MANYLEVTVEDKSYSNPIVTEVNLSATPITATAKMDFSPLGYHDLRANTFNFTVSGTASSYVMISNRAGNPGQIGAGKHYIATAPIPVSIPPESQPLNVISNPYATVAYNGFMYSNDYDTANLWAINVPSFTLANRGQAAYTHPSITGMTISGVSLMVVGEWLIALFNISTGFIAPYQPSHVVRLVPNGAAGALTTNDSFLQVGLNTLSMAQGRYNYSSQGWRNYAVISA